MPTKKDSVKPESTDKADDKKIVIGGDVVGHDIIIGDNNVVTKQTFIQRITNIFKSDAETLEHRNRRILLGHVENAWIKGVLDASLHGAALLDLGIKQDPEAVTQYPWAIKKESTDETLPTGTSMLEIVDSIGMGRSLLILGAPGSGKTTMLLELARGLIARPREDVPQPIPMVFNLSSWTESKTLADWLAQELNNLYSVPRKTAPDWVKGNKLLLLLDGLDEVRQESRAKCVEAINEFRKQNGLTSLAVCSRSQDYADLNAKLSFEGAIEVQPLMQEQITKFFNRLGNEMTGIKQALEKDSALREMAETPLFLSIMIMAYRDKQDVETLTSNDENAQRKYLFDTYIERMLERRSGNIPFKKQKVLHWLSWLASKIVERYHTSFILENLGPIWIHNEIPKNWNIFLMALIGSVTTWIGLESLSFPLMIVGIVYGVIVGIMGGLILDINYGLVIGFIGATMSWLTMWLVFRPGQSEFDRLGSEEFSIFDQKGGFSLENASLVFISYGVIFELIVGLIIGSIYGLIAGLIFGLKVGISVGLVTGLIGGLLYGGVAIIQCYVLRFILSRNNLLPWRLVPFLDHCVDLIFLRRVGGGYIFIHRLLMEHFAEMYVETPTSKGN